MIGRWIPAWQIGTLLAVAVVAVANVISTVQRTPPAAIEAPVDQVDMIVRYERRLAKLRTSVRTRGLTGTVGYFGSMPGGDDYFHAQFALVPLVLDIDATLCEWAVADLSSPPPENFPPAGWRIVEDFGAGVLLLRKTTP